LSSPVYLSPRKSIKIVVHNRKFLKLLRTLDAEELVSFRKYLKRRYGQEEVVLAIFNYLWKFRPDFSEERRLDPAYAYRRIFGTAFDANHAARLANALSDLHLRLKEFLLIESVRRDTDESRFLWLAELGKRGLVDDYYQHSIHLVAELKASSKREVRDYMKSVAAQYLFYFQHQPKKPQDSEQLQDCLDALDIHYALMRLKLACELLVSKSVYDRAYDSSLPDLVMSIALSHRAKRHPLLQIYREIYLLLTDSPEGDYDNAVGLFTQNIGIFSKDELQILNTRLRVYVSIQSNSGRAVSWSNAHKMNQFAVEAGLVFAAGKIAPLEFTNIVTVACNAQDFSWASLFVRSYGGHLEEAVRESTVKLCEITIAHKQEHYAEVISLVQSCRFHRIDDLVRAKFMQVQSVYEVGDPEGNLSEICENFLKSLRRYRTLTALDLTAAKNFIKIVKLLSEKKRRRSEILARINENASLYYRAWLAKKVAVYAPG
jgi:hypothetical protein